MTTGTGGTHLYFAQPGTEALRNTAGRLGPLIDTRGHGGYVVAAGSTVRSRPYVTADDRPITDLPSWLFDALHPLPRTPGPDLEQLIAGIRHRSTYATAALLAEVDRVHLARPGTRNNALNTAAYSLGRLVGTGLLTTDDTTAALHAAATAAGLAEPEITRTIRSGLRAGIHH